MGYSDQIKRDRKSLISLQPELTGYEIMRPKIKGMWDTRIPLSSYGGDLKHACVVLKNNSYLFHN